MPTIFKIEYLNIDKIEYITDIHKAIKLQNILSIDRLDYTTPNYRLKVNKSLAIEKLKLVYEQLHKTNNEHESIKMLLNFDVMHNNTINNCRNVVYEMCIYYFETLEKLYYTK